MNVEQIVKASGVSRSTVFRFLRGDNVRPNAKTAIVSAMTQLGYVQKSAVNRQMHLEIEVSTSEDVDGFLGFAKVIDGITAKAGKLGIQVSLVKRGADKLEADYTNWAGSKLGVIVIGKTLQDERREAELLLGHGIPHVFVNRVMNDNAVSYVAVDVRQAGYDITKHLIGLGRKRIAICGDTVNLRVDRDKIQGYKDALAEHNIPFYNDLCITNADKLHMEQAIQTLLSQSKPDAFVGICDTYAMKFIGIGEKMGCRVPEDIAVVGMDDVVSGEYFRPALTTVHIPFYQIGELAVDSLLKQSGQDVKSVRTIVNHSIVVRDSCGATIKEQK